MMLRLITLYGLLTIISYLNHIFAETIHSINFEGLIKTKESFLRSQIKSIEGGEFKESIVEQDLQSLRNLNLFFKVEASYTKDNLSDSTWNILFTVEEAKYLYPILSISGFKTQLKTQIGFNQINFNGKAQHIGLIYQYYDRHSISAFYNANRHANGKTGHDIALTKYSTIEPLYFSDTTADFNFDNYNLSIGGHYWLSNKIRTGFGGMYMYEKYEQLDTGSLDLGQFEFMFHKFQLRSFLEYNSVNQHYEVMNGIKNYTYFELIETKDYPTNKFLKFTNDFYWYKKIKQNGNLAFHNRIGVATNNISPFSPFVLDGFLNVRGVGNRIIRGTAELISNLEYRQSIIHHKWFILQAVAFSDLGTIRQAGEKLVEMFNDKELKLFVGSGLRINSQLLYKVTFRLDYSFNPINPSEHGLTFGVGHFF